MVNRVEELKSVLEDEREAALVTDERSLRYLCRAPRGILLASREETVFFVSAGDFEAAKARADGYNVKVFDGENRLLDWLIKFNIKKIRIENDKMTVRELNMLKDELHCADFITDDVLSDKISRLCSVKSAAELAAIENANRVCDEAYDKLLHVIRRGMTEREIAVRLGSFLREMGAERPRIRISSGENSSKVMPVTDRKTQEGDFLLIDFSARVGDFYSSLARTVAVGEINPKRETAYNAVTCAVTDGIRALRAGVGAKVPESVAKSTLAAWDIDRFASPVFGCGTGLEPVEQPVLEQECALSLKEDMALVCGAEVSNHGKYGIKIADCVKITADGCVNFTKATKSLIHI